jgi:ribosomal protein S6E (S10)
MAITVVNGTNAEGMEFTINGMTDGSGTPMWSGSLTPAGQQGSQIVQEVSGFETYQVVFYPVGYTGSNEGTSASSPEVTDSVIVAFNIDVEAN